MDWSIFVILLCACGAAATTGAMFQPGDWYKSLDKPTWTPPDWVFPVTWTVLYLFIAAAGARVAVLPGNGHAMAFFAAQIGFNTLWTPIFFGLRNLKAAMGIIVVLWLAVAATMLSFFSLDIWAGLLFVPYLIWCTIAGALNFAVWQRNKNVAPRAA